MKRNLGSQAITKDVQEFEYNALVFLNKLSDDPDQMNANFDHPVLVPHSFD